MELIAAEDKCQLVLSLEPHFCLPSLGPSLSCMFKSKDLHEIPFSGISVVDQQ